MVDVGNGLAHAVHHADVEDVIVVFGVIILVGGGPDGMGGMRQAGFQDFAGGIVGAHFDFFGVEAGADDGEKVGGDGGIHQQGFHGVADGGALAFGVEDDFLGHFQIRVGVHINMANAFVMFDDGHFGAVGHGANEAFAAARHAQIHVLRQREQFLDGLAVGGADDLDGVGGKSGQAPAAAAWVRMSAMA